MNKKIKDEKKDESISIPSFSSFADLSKNILDKFLEASSFSIWLFGSILLIAIFLIVQNFAKETVYFPLFNLNSNGSLDFSLDPVTNATQSGYLKYYKYLGYIKFSFNDLLKFLLLFFLISTLIWFLIKKTVNILKFVLDSLPVDFSPFKKILDYFPQVYKEKKWIADPSPMIFVGASGTKKIVYQQLRHKIPKMIVNFKYAKFKISLLGNYDHWRAGIFITSWDHNQDYVFHIYKNENDQQLRTRITKRIYSEGHVNQKDQNLQVEDKNNFLFEIKGQKNNLYELYVNNQLVDQYLIPKEDFKFIDIAGWADDRQYKMEFSNIEVLG